MPIQWLIEDWLPIGHRAEDTAPEGSFKTIFGACCAVHIAAGAPMLGHQARQGPVLIVDEETPRASLESHLERFSLGLGIADWHQLPISVLSFTGFRFSRKPELNKLVQEVKRTRPVFVRLDSLLAMLPSGRQGLSENDCKLGEYIRDDLNTVLGASPDCATLLAAHSKKYTVDLDIDELMRSEMQTLVRGHGSIVGEGCDTGYLIKKISVYPRPTCFALIIKPRRLAIPSSDRVTYIQLEEQAYGSGWARLVEIPAAAAFPPSRVARELFAWFLDGEEHKASAIRYRYSLHRPGDLKRGIDELLAHRVIANCDAQEYRLNGAYAQQCHPTYLAGLT